MPLKTECKGNTIFSNSKNTSHIEFRAEFGPVKVLAGSVRARSSPDIQVRDPASYGSCIRA